MAELNGILSKLTGSAGQLTFRRVKGRTIVSEKTAMTTNSRTSAQQQHRLRWTNLIKMYSGVAPLLNGAFEKKSPRLSDYNMFMKLNFASSKIYLTKGEVTANACVAAPYQITMGSLPGIRLTGEAGASVTDIRLGSLVIGPDTTVREFSNAVVTNNADYDYGDQLSFLLVVQQTDEVTGCPQCRFYGEAVVLDKNAEARLHDCVSGRGFSSVGGQLACSLDDSFQGAYAWVHTRLQKGVTLVSTQKLVVKNDLYEAYSSDEAYRRAVATYGGETNNFLTPAGGTEAVRLPAGGSTDEEPGSDPENGGSDPENGGGNEDTGGGGGTEEGGDDGPSFG